MNIYYVKGYEEGFKAVEFSVRADNSASALLKAGNSDFIKIEQELELDEVRIIKGIEIE